MIAEFIAEHITGFIESTGYISVFVLMVMESMVFPVPSEAVMPFAGFLVSENKFTFEGVIFFSTLGSIAGSLISYYLGAYGGKPFLNRYGQYLLLNHDDLESTERFFKKHGEITILVSRFIPVVRHLISIPTGVGGMDVMKFSLYTIIGAGIWNTILAVGGFYLKENWDTVMKYTGIIDILVIIALIALLAIFVYSHLKRRNKRNRNNNNS